MWRHMVASAMCVALVGCGTSSRPQADPDDSDAPAEAGAGWQWVSYRDLEVRAPAAWRFNYEAGRPDCINDPKDPKDPWARDVPRAPYVTLGTPSRPVPAIGCFRKPPPGSPDPSFGAVPFVLWQPHVKLDEARTNPAGPEYEDGHWQHRGWQLTRKTIDNVQITVLASPADASLESKVLGSVHHVKTTALGCETRSPVQAARFIKPDSAPIPSAQDAAAVAVCEYDRTPDHAGLEGSRRITGSAARSLVAAIHGAPTGGGPDQPRSCGSDVYGDHAIALRFFGSAAETKTPLAEAYVYYDSCIGNGIVDAQQRRRLTRADCVPLFDTPPIGFWGGTARLFDACSKSP